MALTQETAAKVVKFIKAAAPLLTSMAETEEAVGALAPKVANDIIASKLAKEDDREALMSHLADHTKTIDILKDTVKLVSERLGSSTKVASDSNNESGSEADRVFEQNLGLR